MQCDMKLDCWLRPVNHLPLHSRNATEQVVHYGVPGNRPRLHVFESSFCFSTSSWYSWIFFGFVYWMMQIHCLLLAVTGCEPARSNMFMASSINLFLSGTSGKISLLQDRNIDIITEQQQRINTFTEQASFINVSTLSVRFFFWL